MTSRISVMRVGALVLTLVGASALAGCATAAPIAADLSHEPEHSTLLDVHAIDVDDARQRVTVATHSGLFSIDISPAADPAAPLAVWGSYRGDVMGLVRAGDRFVFSGHPEAGSSDAPNVGVLAADLDGAQWEQLALTGEVDFHAMSYSGNNTSSLLVGLDSSTGMVMTSIDGGRVWQEGAALPARDIAIDPSGSLLIATTAAGPQLSANRGLTWTLIEQAPLLVLVESGFDVRGDPVIVGVDVEGVLHVSSDGRTWIARGELPFLPDAIGVGALGTIAIVSTQQAMASRDGGVTWSLIANTALPAVTGGH